MKLLKLLFSLIRFAMQSQMTLKSRANAHSWCRCHRGGLTRKKSIHFTVNLSFDIWHTMGESECLTALFMLLYLMFLDRKVCRVVSTILGLCIWTVIRIVCVCLLLKKWINLTRKCLLVYISKYFHIKK